MLVPVCLTLSTLMQRLLGNWHDDTVPAPHKAGVWTDEQAQIDHLAEVVMARYVIEAIQSLGAA